ncbi:MAG: glycerol-3-phosphate 1-O-acyltransferase PlsY [Marinifilaceae bacterium]
MYIFFEILFCVLVFIWGSIPFGFILTKRFTGRNILILGSGNIGSTNVCRVAGRRVSIYTQLLDMLKGLLPVAFLLYLNGANFHFTSFYVYIIALSSIVGHDFSIFLKFNGGKGVNTTLGASLLIVPIPVFISVIVYFIVKSKFKYVSLASILLAISLPISYFFIYGLNPTFYYLLICTFLIIFRHNNNIERLLNHRELH